MVNAYVRVEQWWWLNIYEKEKIINEKYTAPSSSSTWNPHHNADNLAHGHPQLANWTVLALNNICQLWRARSTGCNKSKLEKDLFTNNMFSPTTCFHQQQEHQVGGGLKICFDQILQPPQAPLLIQIPLTRYKNILHKGNSLSPISIFLSLWLKHVWTRVCDIREIPGTNEYIQIYRSTSGVPLEKFGV